MDDHESRLPATVAYLPGARGHAVMAIGADTDGRASFAVWRVDTAGVAVGAWVVPVEEHETILSTWDGCAVLGKDAAERLGLKATLVRVDDLVAEIAEHRRLYEKANEQFRRTAKSKILPLSWPTNIEAVQASAPVAAASPVAGAALAVMRKLQQAIELWLDTEHVRSRRAHLRALGDVKPLPPRWTAALRAAREA